MKQGKTALDEIIDQRLKTGADKRSFVSLAFLLWRLHKPVGFVAV
jgi:hypothetical protein